MTWKGRILALTLGRDAERDLRSTLAGLRLGLRDRAAALLAVADLAPSPGAGEELRRLAARQSTLADELNEFFGESAAEPFPSSGADAPAGPAALNHWARLVRQLELHRAARDRLLEARTAHPPERPDAVALLDGIAAAIDSALSSLRMLIAQADPQALN